MRRKVPTLTTVLLSACLPALCQVTPQIVPQQGPDRVQSRRELRSGRPTRHDDLRDLARLQSLASRFDAAREAKNKGALSGVCAEVRALALGEIDQAKVDPPPASATAASGRPPIAQAGIADSAPPPISGTQTFTAARKDPPAGTRNGPAKAAAQKRRLEIATQIRDMPNPIDPGHMKKVRSMLGELIDLARADVGQDSRALRDDRRERRVLPMEGSEDPSQP